MITPKGGSAADWMLTASGEAAALMRRVDWSTTSLGPLSAWPASLRNTVATLLRSRHPMFLWWGPDLVQIYNDAYIPSFGVGKHPAAMGQCGRDCWKEIWHIIGPQIEDVTERGIPSWHEDALVPIYRNGTIEEVYWTYGYSPVLDDEGFIGGVLVVCTETTARVVAARREADLRRETDRAHQRLLEFFAQAPAGICILRGPSFTFEFANDHYRALVGGREVVGRPLLEAMPELVGQGISELLHGVMTSGQPLVGREVRLVVDRHGKGAPAEGFYTFIYSPLRNTFDFVDGIVVLVMDVTEEVRARHDSEEMARQLRVSEAHFHQLAESIPQLAWAVRPDGHVDWYNQRWFEYTGTTRAQMDGWGWTSVLDPQRVDEIVTRWRVSLASGQPFEMEFTLRGHDGVRRWHLTRAVPLRDESGQIARWFGTNTDVDMLRRAEDERLALLEGEKRARLAAESASRAKDDFLATASHELRTPLSAILGWAQLLDSGKLGPSDMRRATLSIQRNARAQVRLIDDILDVSRIINGQFRLDVRPLDFTAVITSALDAVRAAADAKRIAIHVALEPEAAHLVGDPERLQQVVWNLLVNAIKFTPKEGHVHVSLTRAGSDVHLTVRDTGEGIEAAFLPHVFERFRQAEGNSTRRHGGLGLGLALVRHLVEAHGGTVGAESAGRDRGARFTVSLPVVAPTPLIPATRVPSVASPSFLPPGRHLAGVAVLVVDDEIDALDVVATTLRLQGAEVATAKSAGDAVKLLESRSFAILVSDLGMPGTDGYELVRQARSIAARRGLPLRAVALSAYTREQDKQRALSAGYDAHVAKPFEPAELINAMVGSVELEHRY